MHSKARGIRALQAELKVDAHLCEVYGQVIPEEPFRDPTWFSAAKTRRKLYEERRPRYGAELARIVDQATAEILTRHRKQLH
jgi:hypothetical protein